jgi:hypothetical protein
VATSLVYLIRSLGNIYGVTITSAIVQNVLKARLPEALKHVENKDLVCRDAKDGRPLLIRSKDYRRDSKISVCHS